MTRRIAHFLALAILLGCARESTVHEVPPSRPVAEPIPSETASSTVPQAPSTSNLITDSVIGDADDESVPPMEDSVEFSCSPKSLGPRDTLTLQLATPHGGELMVLTPGDVFFSLVYPAGADPRKYSIVPSEEFATMSILKVPIDIRLPPHVYGKDTIPEAIFSRPGQYVLQMGDRMESDHTGPPYICRVMFTP